jgi:hypothetical protein
MDRHGCGARTALDAEMRALLPHFGATLRLQDASQFPGLHLDQCRPETADASSGIDTLHLRAFDKPTALGFALVLNHPVLDGKKGVGHTVMEVFLVLNGHELDARLRRSSNLADR